ncbi:hypothetical protein [Emticicia soli]|uniref:Uncharacterized protein n=1 Tax=Emticicia soli TaxID=2027878 RepID=A0ABW5JBY8_9BACT
MAVNSNILILEEAAALSHITPDTSDNEIIHILLKKLYMSDTEEYLFDSPDGFWTDTAVRRMVSLLTTENNLACISTNRDMERVYLKISKHGIDISKQGGWLKYLSFRAAYQSGTYTVFE